MIVYVHSADIYDRGRPFGRHAGMRDVVHVTIPARTPVAEIAQRVIDVVHNERSIWLLILNGHGWAARVEIGEGLNAWNVFDLEALRPYMTPGGRGVEIHACHVASADSVDGRPFLEVGIEFMGRLAHVLNVDVRASTYAQVGVDENWLGLPLRGSDLEGRLEGDMLLVHPHGGGSSHAEGY